MGLLLKFIYEYIFLYFAMPVFAFIILGRPKFIIRIINKILNIEEPVKKIKLFNLVLVICVACTLWCYYQKWDLHNLVIKMTIENPNEHYHHSEHKKEHQRHHQYSGYDDKYRESKIREMHLYERDTYMFLCFCVLIIIVNKFCIRYLRIWDKEEESKNIKEQIKQLNDRQAKSPTLKKME